MASNGEDPVAAVRGADGGSGNAVPRHVIPERGQVPENGSPDGSVMESEDVRHVLDEHVSRHQLANDASELGPESSLRVSEASPLAGGRCTLAREAARDAVDRGEVAGADRSDVIVNRAPWESPGEQSAAPFVTLNEPGVVASGLVESGVEQAGT